MPRTNTGCEAEAEQATECEDVIGNAAPVGVMALDNEVGAMVEQAVEYMRRLTGSGGDDPGMERSSRHLAGRATIPPDLSYDGNDLVCGTRWRDYVEGGNGNDRLYGFVGDDALLGGAGADQLWGGEGNDGVDGGIGDDILRGENGNDTISGGIGTDT